MSIHPLASRSLCICALLALALNTLANEGTTVDEQSNSAEPVETPLGPSPDPALRPDEVVRIQLEALRQNDAADHGIEVCFRFASPNNQSNTGPVGRFGEMIKTGPYSLMLDYHDAQYAEVEIREDRARQLVTLKGTSETITYGFYLSLQTHEACDGCWMTDTVTIEKVEKTLSAGLTPANRNTI